ncbi:TPA: TraB/VirB10 family protein [Vibrio cholerae O1]
MKKLTDAVHGWWFTKSFEERKRFTKWTVLAGAFAVYVFTGYYLENKSKTDTANPTEPPQTEVVLLDTPQDVLEKDIIALATESIDQKVQDAKVDFEQQLSQLTPIAEPSPEIVVDGAQRLQLDTRFPVPPGANNETPLDYGNQGEVSVPQEDATQPQSQAEQWVRVGGLRRSQATTEDYSKAALPELQQAEERKITLPVGFMKARLLVGINARSGEFGMSNPQQLVFLVQAPAQLPNKIKMDTAGCFVVTNAFGDISSGRIEAPPVSLTCLTHKGKYIAEAKGLKGFVQDQDGKRGLDARVVSRARHLLASSLFARTIEAFGSLGVAQGMVTSSSPLGTVQTVDSDKLAQTALAKGAEGSANDLSQYLLDLAKNTHPIMEHGAGKSVLLWLAETTELEIKEMKQ